MVAGTSRTRSTHGDMHNLKGQSHEPCPTTFFNKNGLFSQRSLFPRTSCRDQFPTLASPMALMFSSKITNLHDRTCLLRKFLSLNINSCSTFSGQGRTSNFTDEVSNLKHIKENNNFSSFALGSAHVKFDV